MHLKWKIIAICFVLSLIMRSTDAGFIGDQRDKVTGYIKQKAKEHLQRQMWNYMEDVIMTRLGKLRA